jgi:two-component system KDP operon response regulator KdpE
LTRTEFRLLRLLLVNRDHTVSFADILLSVWGEGYVTEIAFVHTYISRLRRKIEPDPKEPKYLIGERGLGYCFVSHD